MLGPRGALVHLRASHLPQPGSDVELPGGARARVVARAGELFELELDRDVVAFLEAHGETPLPPYIERAADAADRERYQTVFARAPGAVAAPTAGLHFDVGLLAALAARGVERAFLTLHVGAGTFAPVRTERIEDHELHAEWLRGLRGRVRRGRALPRARRPRRRRRHDDRARARDGCARR